MTDGQTVRRLGGQVLRCAAGVTVLLTAYPPNRLSAQVGHPPGRSPFHDLRRGAGPTLTFGYFGGDVGRAGVGPLSGTAWQARYEFALGGPSLITLGASYVQTERYIVDPYKGATARKSGPINNDVIGVELGLQLRLTGGKTWHGLAPYLGTALGLAFGSTLASDTSGYDLGTRFTIAPGAGVRWHPGRHLNVQLDARALFLKLKYPDTFHFPSPVDESRVLRLEQPLTEWTRHPWISLGVGWIF